MKNHDKRPLTPQEESLKAYNSKLKREAVLKSLIVGLSIGFLLGVLVSIVSFATTYNTLWIALALWAVATVGFSVLFYFKRYRPDTKSTAERVDGIGLEERVITMMQFKDSDNPMVNRQRADAQTALKTVSTKNVKMRVSKLFIIILVVVMCVSVFMVTYSTVRAVNAEAESNNPPPTEEVTDEDRIIRDMIEALREEIDSAKISDELRSQLHQLVDDLEASLKPTDSLEIKIAKIMDTADKIHKLIQDYLNRSTIAEELMKHDTTYDLGYAIDSKDIDKVSDAFQKMYDSIAPWVEQGNFDLIAQTADDIDQALEDAINTPPDLQKALEDLRDALRNAIPPPPEEEGEQPKTADEINQELQDAFENAKDALADFFEQQQEQDQNSEELDDALQDIIKDAMDQLGQEFEYPEDPEEDEQDKNEEEEGNTPEDGESESGSPTPNPDDGSLKDTVINGEINYKDIFDEGYADELRELLESGTLTDEERQIIQDYLDSLT